jgi:O-antigen/teichoic acid export membrane protein
MNSKMAVQSNRFVRRLLGGLPGEGDSARLVRGAGIAFSLQVCGAGIAFALQVLLGRWMGVTGYGAYAYTVAWAGLLAVAAGLGLPTTVLRFIPAYAARRDWTRLHGLLRASLLITVLASVGAAALGTLAVLWLRSRGTTVAWDVILGIWLIPLLALMTLQQEVVRAFRRIGLAYSPVLVLRPTLVIIGAALYIGLGKNLTSTAALCITVGAIALILVVQALLFWRGLDLPVRTAKPTYETRGWLRVALPLLLIASFTIILSQTDIVMVGAFLGSRAAGLYAAASKTAGLVGLVLIAVNAIAAPMFSSLFAENRHDRLQALASSVARWAFWPSLVISVFLALLAKPILGLFGSQFSAAHWQLTVLLVGQLVNAAAGSVGYLMILTGHQREAAWVYGWVAVAHVAMNAAAIPLIGALGAAVATTTSLSLWNFWLYVLVVRRLDIDASIFSGRSISDP